MTADTPLTEQKLDEMLARHGAACDGFRAFSDEDVPRLVAEVRRLRKDAEWIVEVDCHFLSGDREATTHVKNRISTINHLAARVTPKTMRALADQAGCYSNRSDVELALTEACGTAHALLRDLREAGNDG